MYGLSAEYTRMVDRMSLGVGGIYRTVGGGDLNATLNVQRSTLNIEQKKKLQRVSQHFQTSTKTARTISLPFFLVQS